MTNVELKLIGSKKNGYYWRMNITKVVLSSITYTTKKGAIIALIDNKIKWNIIEDQNLR